MATNFEQLERLIEQHLAFDPFLRAHKAGKWIGAEYVHIVMDAVDRGVHEVNDVQFPPMSETNTTGEMR